jgi:hypothetical protein
MNAPNWMTKNRVKNAKMVTAVVASLGTLVLLGVCVLRFVFAESSAMLGLYGNVVAAVLFFAVVLFLGAAAILPHMTPLVPEEQYDDVEVEVWKRQTGAFATENPYGTWTASFIFQPPKEGSASCTEDTKELAFRRLMWGSPEEPEMINDPLSELAVWILRAIGERDHVILEYDVQDFIAYAGHTNREESFRAVIDLLASGLITRHKHAKGEAALSMSSEGKLALAFLDTSPV